MAEHPCCLEGRNIRPQTVPGARQREAAGQAGERVVLLTYPRVTAEDVNWSAGASIAGRTVTQLIVKGWAPRIDQNLSGGGNRTLRGDGSSGWSGYRPGADVEESRIGARFNSHSLVVRSSDDRAGSVP